MTSLAALFDWLAAGKSIGQSSRAAVDYRVRTLPREEVHLYIKPINNSTVIRLVDQKDWLASVGMAGAVVAASLLLIALLLPGGYSLMASRHMEQLRDERTRLTNQLRILRSREAALLSPQRLQEYAGDKFVTPTAASMIFAPPASRGTVASLVKR